MPTTVRSHAKINLGLGIGAPRVDGFHALATAYQTLELHDLVTVTLRPPAAPAPPAVGPAVRLTSPTMGQTSIRITSNDARVPTDRRNTAWKMVELALRELGVEAEVEIHIEKRLPVQGGLGAGSANAVAALVGLEVELGDPSWTAGNEAPRYPRSQNRDLGHPAELARVGNTKTGWPARRLDLAAKVGSDVPLFLIGGTVLGLDRGQEVYPLPEIEATWCVLATPAVGVSTPLAFRDWDALCAQEGLTAEASADKLKELSRAYASAFAKASPEVASGSSAQAKQGAGSSGVLAQTNQSGHEDLAGRLESALVRTGITSWIQNDFERVVFRQHPSLAEIKRTLAANGTPEAALHASLSGSGSALYGLYLSRGDAEAACERLRAAGVKSFLTRTVARGEYWGQMVLQ